MASNFASRFSTGRSVETCFQHSRPAETRRPFTQEPAAQSLGVELPHEIVNRPSADSLYPSKAGCEARCAPIVEAR